MFRFKQFSVDQTGCAMKINTDGVLLGAMANAVEPKSILDIGAGTGVIALMLAQRFQFAQIDAVEIDSAAARTAGANFSESPFAERLHIFESGFEQYFDLHPAKQYDLIVSNPPFYVGSLKSPGVRKSLAKHTDFDFFERLIAAMSLHLARAGCCWMVLPLNLLELVGSEAHRYGLFVANTVYVRSFALSQPHRAIICLSLFKGPSITGDVVIYSAKDVYSEKYRSLLQPYFLAF
jgi:tRNA1Val (adenine37-N6)-methyltransferase